MAENDVIRSMVMAFRLSELQTLLHFAGKSRIGRKVHLQHRAVALVKLNTPEIKEKVRELSAAMYKSLAEASSVNPYSDNYDNRSRPQQPPEEEDPPPPPPQPQQQQPRREMRQSTRENSRASAVAASSTGTRERARNSSSSSSSSRGGLEMTARKTSKERVDHRVCAPTVAPKSIPAPPTQPSVTPRYQQPASSSSHVNLPPASAATALPPAAAAAAAATPSSSAAVSAANSRSSSSSSSPQIVHQSLGRGGIPDHGLNLGFNNYQYDRRLQFPTFPDVRLRPLPFYKVLATLMQPCSLQPSGTARFQEQKFSFYLSPSQANEIASSSYRDCGLPQYKRQIMMRFSLLETTAEQDDNFPSNLVVKVNNKLQALPNALPTNKPGMEPKRPPRPLNITCLSKLSSTQPNIIDISWAVDFGRGYTVSVYYVDKLSANDLMSELKKRGTRLPDYTRALIKEKLNDKDADIATTSCKVTLACPLGKMRMTYPCRANTCDHLQCFDASLYLMMNERKPKWLCPVCNKSAFFDNLLLDGFFKELVSSPRLPSDDHEIVLHNDGSWDPLPAKKDPRSAPPSAQSTPSRQEPQQASSSKPVEKIETFSVDDDDDEDASTSGSRTSSAANKSQDLIPEKRTIDCITLDSDSSDDNDNNDGDDEDDSDDVIPTRKRPRNSFLDDSPTPSPVTPPRQDIPPSPELPVLICLDD